MDRAGDLDRPGDSRATTWKRRRLARWFRTRCLGGIAQSAAFIRLGIPKDTSQGNDSVLVARPFRAMDSSRSGKSSAVWMIGSVRSNTSLQLTSGRVAAFLG